MTLLIGEELPGDRRRTYHIEVPADPVQAVLPVIIVFHGGGQDAATIAARWGVGPSDPVPPDLANYLLVFPESDPLPPERKLDAALPVMVSFPRPPKMFSMSAAMRSPSPEDPSLAAPSRFNESGVLREV